MTTTSSYRAPRWSSYRNQIILTMLVAACVLPASAATNLVRLVNFAFQPPILTNNAGDTVLWTNTTLTSHNVVSSNSAWTSSPLFTSPGTFSVTFTNAGTYGYFCSPHHTFGMTGIIYVRPVNQPPVVTLTNPASGITLAAPATITLRADASDPDGTVTNVEFLSGAVPLGNATTSPYAFTATNLSTGVYNFTAQAVDNLGMSKTSSVVTVTVVSPGPIRFDNPPALKAGNLSLRLSLTPNLSYAIDYTTNFASWQLFASFVATNSTMQFSAPTANPSGRFFRARLLPNP